MRRVSPYVTRVLLGAPLSANTLTSLLVPAGLLAALCLTLPGVWAAVGAVLFVQLQLLLDCVDGEVARWRKTYSPAGIYLDQIGHYSTEAALPAALGIRAAGGWDSIDGGWTAVGLVVAVLILFLKSETHLVRLALARSGRSEKAFGEDPIDTTAPVRTRVLRVRQGPRLLPAFRPFQAVEASLAALAAAVADVLADSLDGTRTLLLVLVAAALAAVVGHLLSILRSSRLR